jgi:hypothetical protein
MGIYEGKQSRTLVEVLEDWSAQFGRYFLYFPGRRQQPAALAALCLDR